MDDRQPRPARPKDGAAVLTRADLELLATIAAGVPAQAAARQLGISDRTLRRRTNDVCGRIGVSTAVEAVAWAARRNLI